MKQQICKLFYHSKSLHAHLLRSAADITFYGFKGQVLHSLTRPVVDPPEVLRVFRDEIGRQLIDEAQRLYPDAIQFHFNCPIEVVDLAKQTVSTKSNTSQVSIILNLQWLRKTAAARRYKLPCTLEGR